MELAVKTDIHCRKNFGIRLILCKPITFEKQLPVFNYLFVMCSISATTWPFSFKLFGDESVLLWLFIILL